jgi:hypothetical protein
LDRLRPYLLLGLLRHGSALGIADLRAQLGVRANWLHLRLVWATNLSGTTLLPRLNLLLLPWLSGTVEVSGATLLSGLYLPWLSGTVEVSGPSLLAGLS